MRLSSIATILSKITCGRLMRSRGATLVELSLAMPLVLALMYVIVDLSRYWAVQGMLTQAAQRGMNLAIKVADLELDKASDPSYDRFLKARMRVVCGDTPECLSNPHSRNGAAVQLPLGTLVSSWENNEAAVRFVGFDSYRLQGGATGTVNAILLRPGDPCVTDRAGTQHCHPTVGPATGPIAPTARRRSNGEKMKALLEREPMVVVMPVQFRTLLPLPFFGNYAMSGVASGYREIISSGAYPSPPEQPTPTVAPGDDDDDDDNDPVPTPTPVCPNNCSNQHASCAASNFNCAVCDRGSCVCSNSCAGGG